MSAAMVVVTVAKTTRGVQRNQCANPKETDFRKCTWVKMSAEITRKHVWWNVSASHSRAAESTREETVPMLVSDDGRGWNHWHKASQANTATAEMSQSASQT